MSEDFNTNEWRRDNIFENEIPHSSKIKGEIMNIILKYGGEHIPDTNYNDLVEDIYKYMIRQY